MAIGNWQTATATAWQLATATTNGERRTTHGVLASVFGVIVSRR